MMISSIKGAPTENLLELFETQSKESNSENVKGGCANFLCHDILPKPKTVKEAKVPVVSLFMLDKSTALKLL